MKKRMIVLLLALGLLAGCTSQAAPGGDFSQEPPVQTDGAQAETPDEQTGYEQVTLYLPNDDADGLTEKTVQVAKSDDAVVELVQALVSEGALPEGTEVASWSVEHTDPPALTVDLNDAFAQAITRQGTAGETIIMAALVNTIWAYYEPASLTLTANGQTIVTGHNEYDQPFTSPMAFI